MSASRGRGLVVGAALILGAVLGAAAVAFLSNATDGSTSSDWERDLDAARALGPLPAPAPCATDLDDPDLLPNAPRPYRSGVHRGIDFICGELGHDATTPLAGRVVFAHDGEEPSPEDRDRLLGEAAALGATPTWTLVALMGRFVVVDHGTLPGAGHVVTVYAHLADIDPRLRLGRPVAAGDRIGGIGNSGTGAAGRGDTSPDSYHLHWELHLDGEPLGLGASAEQTAEIYRALREP